MAQKQNSESERTTMETEAALLRQQAQRAAAENRLYQAADLLMRLKQLQQLLQMQQQHKRPH